MMTPIINTRSDLDALRGTPDFAAALRALLGATTTWINHGTREAPDWEQVTVLSYIEALGFTHGEFLAECAAAGIVPQQPEPPAAVAQTAAVPQSVSMYQARRALLDAGLLDAVDGAVQQADRSVQIAWEYAVTVERNSPFIAAMQPALGLTDEQVDALFAAAKAV